MAELDLTPLFETWRVGAAAVGVTDAEATLASGGDPRWQTRIASVGKLLTGLAALVAVEEGTLDLVEPAGPAGSTVRHLLAHASGLPFEGRTPIAPPGQRRIYSNTGFELLAEHLEKQAGMSFGHYLQVAVVEPLGLRTTELRGSPAHGFHSTVYDLLAFARQLLRPTLIAPATMTEATRPQFPDLKGVLPGVGSFDPNPWGLAFEVRAGKSPHWTGTANSPATYGHFGGAGTFLWVDPAHGLACVALTDREFGPWALDAWPRFSDEVLRAFAG